MRVGITALAQICLQQIDFYAAIVVSLVPLAQVVVTEAIGTRLVGEQGDNAVLRLALGARYFRHGNLPQECRFPRRAITDGIINEAQFCKKEPVIHEVL